MRQHAPLTPFERQIEEIRRQSTPRLLVRLYEGPLTEEVARALPAIDREQVEAEIGESCWSGPPPSAEELGCDVSGLLPARAELVRIEAWRVRTAGEIVERRSWQMELEAQIAAPAGTEAALRELLAGEKAGLIARIKSGISPTAAAASRTEERTRLEAQRKRLPIDVVDSYAAAANGGGV